MRVVSYLRWFPVLLKCQFPWCPPGRKGYIIITSSSIELMRGLHVPFRVFSFPFDQRGNKVALSGLMCVSILCFVTFSSLIFTRAINGVFEVLTSDTADGTWEETRKNTNKNNIISAGAKNVLLRRSRCTHFPPRLLFNWYQGPIARR